MRLSSLSLNVPRRDLETDPESIFRRLTLRGGVQNIWAPQADALQQWHSARAEKDLVVEMSTGGGKTLVCLLIAQSIVNETRGHVLYVCPTNQLVEQTVERAKECGIEVASYQGRTWTRRDVYDACTGPCVTNYAAVFNGFSIFRDHELAAVVLDDAHVAGDTIRDQFTVRIPPDHPAFRPLLTQFRPHFARRFLASAIDRAADGDHLALLFVPMHEVAKQRDLVRQILIKNGVAAESASTRFAWEHLKDHLHTCTVLISGVGVEITPPILPLKSLRTLGGSTRRVFATATLPSQTEFQRTFASSAGAKHIVPGGKSGEAQRLFLFVEGATDAECQERAKQLTAPYKTCVITPSIRGSSAWCPPATRFETGHGDAGIRAFAQSTQPAKMLLAGRYDGIDLPGDACRILVLDGLPEGASLLERFMDQSLLIERLRTAHTARRIVQAVGRIFRSNTDHGAVLICDTGLQRWLKNPSNQRYLPGLLQRQIQLGIELSLKIEQGAVTSEQLLSGLLSGDSEWDALYTNYIDAFAAQPPAAEPDWLRDQVIRETDAYTMLWSGQYREAALQYEALAEESDSLDKPLAAWYRHWSGVAWGYAGDQEVSDAAFVVASNARADLGRPESFVAKPRTEREGSIGEQASRIVESFNGKEIQTDRKLERVREDLQYGPKTASTEQALQDLGEMLGLRSYRPDKDQGTGPDVFWCYEEKKAGAAIEAKTDKAPDGTYTKHEIGQYHDSLQWVSQQFPDFHIRKVIAGRKLRLSSETNPPDDLRVVEIDAFSDLLERTARLYALLRETQQENRKAMAESWLVHLGLNWPQCVDALSGWRASDLKQEVRVGGRDG